MTRTTPDNAPTVGSRWRYNTDPDDTAVVIATEWRTAHGWIVRYRLNGLHQYYDGLRFFLSTWRPEAHGEAGE